MAAKSCGLGLCIRRIAKPELSDVNDLFIVGTENVYEGPPFYYVYTAWS